MRPKSIPGLDRSNVYSCEEALRNYVPLGKHLAIIGGGQVGIEAAIHFNTVGHDVTVVEMADKLMPDPPFVQNANIIKELMAAGTGTYRTGTKLVEVDAEGIVVETAEVKRTSTATPSCWLWAGLPTSPGARSSPISAASSPSATAPSAATSWPPPARPMRP